MKKITEKINSRFSSELSKKIFVCVAGVLMLAVLMILLISLTPKVGFGAAAAISVFGFIAGTTLLSLFLYE